MTSPVAGNPFFAARDRYADDTPLMVRELWGPYLNGNQGPGNPETFQDAIMRAYDHRDRFISVRACHGPGKTAVASWLALKQLLFVFPQRTVVTAPSGPQLWDALWNEIVVWMGRLPQAWQDRFDVSSDRIALKGKPKESWISARTCRAESPEALHGVHCEGGRTLLICDEGSGIPDVVYNAGQGSMAEKNATTLILSNPTRVEGLFWESHVRPVFKDRWTRFTISAFDSSRVPQSFIDDIATRHGVDSNEYRIRVLGEFPLQNQNAYIPARLVTSATERDIKPTPGMPIVWGLDPSRGGDLGDRPALCKRQGNVVLEPVKAFVIREPDTMKVVGAVKNEWDMTMPSSRPTHIFVDCIGIGAGVADRLMELGLPAYSVNVAETAAVSGKQFHRVRDELWGALKAWLQTMTCKLPVDEDLAKEISTPEQEFRSTGEGVIESKAKLTQRLGYSPDLAEALILTFALDAASVLYGSGASARRTQPFKRNIGGLV